MFKKNEPSNPGLYRKADSLLAHRKIPLEQAIYIIQRQGYLITPLLDFKYNFISAPLLRGLGFMRSFSEWHLDYEVSIFFIKRYI